MKNEKRYFAILFTQDSEDITIMSEGKITFTAAAFFETDENGCAPLFFKTRAEAEQHRKDEEIDGVIIEIPT